MTNTEDQTEIPHGQRVSAKATEEKIFLGRTEQPMELSAGVIAREFASARCGAKGMSTGIVTFLPGVELAYHKHSFSEAVTVIQGKAVVAVEGRRYQLGTYDCIHVPSGVAHSVANPSSRSELLVHSAFADPVPSREFVEEQFIQEDRLSGLPRPEDPEHLVRKTLATAYELADGTNFFDLFAGRMGSVGICGGYGEFVPGSSLPCHIHDYDESITIVDGEATCEAMGRRYVLSGCDTAFVPQGHPHRFLNLSNRSMAIIWVYAGNEPDRIIVDTTYCTDSRRGKAGNHHGD